MLAPGIDYEHITLVRCLRKEGGDSTNSMACGGFEGIDRKINDAARYDGIRNAIECELGHFNVGLNDKRRFGKLTVIGHVKDVLLKPRITFGFANGDRLEVRCDLPAFRLIEDDRRRNALVVIEISKDGAGIREDAPIVDACDRQLVRSHPCENPPRGT